MKTEPVITVNLSTRGVLDAARLLEYCNFHGGTELSDMRRRNGDEAPFDIRFWCLGNEQYGDWEIGQKPAIQYAWLARETAKMMKKVDPSLKIIVCGNPLDMEWNRTVLDICWEWIDFISLHEVFSVRTSSPSEYLRSIDAFEEKIRKTASVCEATRILKCSKKEVKISVDEWILWDFDCRRRPEEKWGVGPHLLEQDFTILDAAIAGEILSAFHNLADKVGLACIAQSVNVIAPIRTAPNGVSWRQSVFYPFSLTSRHGRGTALKIDASGDLHASVVLNRDAGELVFFLVNRNPADAMPLKADVAKLELSEVVEALSMSNEDLAAVNKPDEEILKPRELSSVKLAKNSFEVQLAPLSWSMIRIKIGDGK